MVNTFSLEVAKGEHVFLIGPSGSGKTTLLNLITGVLAPSKGQIEILGQNLSAMRSASRDAFRADSFGIIFQLFNLIPYLSVIENVLLPLRFSAKRNRNIDGSPEVAAVQLLKNLGLGDELFHKNRCADLSVGQQQRVAAARALLGSPEIIIADEPTSALDSDSREEFLGSLFTQCEAHNTTLLFVSHDSSLRNRFSRVLSLEGKD